MKKLLSFTLALIVAVSCVMATAVAAVDDDQLILKCSWWNGEMFACRWRNVGGFDANLVLRALIQLKADGSAAYDKCDLASAYTRSEDGLTYAVTLRDDILWHDGVAMTVDDVTWSVKTFLKYPLAYAIIKSSFSKVVGAQAYMDGTADEIEGMTVEGNTITFKLAEPLSSFEFALGEFKPLPMHLLENEDPTAINNAAYWQNPVGNGPFAVTEVQPGNYAIYDYFDGFYGEEPQIKKIRVLLDNNDINATASRAAELASTDGLDYFVTSDLATIELMRDYPHYSEFINENVIYFRYLLVNMVGRPGEAYNEAMSDIRVRQAILYALDLDLLIEQFYGEVADVNITGVASHRDFFNSNIEGYSYNPEKAKELLAEANWDYDYPLTIITRYTDQTTKDFLDAVQYYLEQVGFKCNWYIGEGSSQVVIYENRDFDMYYGAIAGLTIDETYSMFAAGLIPTLIGIDEHWVELYSELVSSTSTEEWTSKILEMQEYEMNESLVRLPLYTRTKEFNFVNTYRVTLPEGIQFGVNELNYDVHFEDWALN